MPKSPSPAARPEGLSFIPDMASLVSIADEATVSRTILKAEGAKIVEFAFDRGQELTEHTAAMPVFVQVLDGLAEITADGRTVELAPGGVVHFSTRLPHAVRALEPTRMILIMIDGLAGR